MVLVYWYVYSYTCVYITGQGMLMKKIKVSKKCTNKWIQLQYRNVSNPK